jgi:hypothetical protein
MKFEISTPLGFTVRTSEEYWQRLIIKHPDIEELEELVQSALAEPDEVRRSSRDAEVILSGTERKTLGCCSDATLKWRWIPDYSLPNRCN